MTITREILRVLSLLLFCIPLQTDAQTELNSEGVESGHILKIDRFVPHISTVPGIEGQEVQLFLRERVRRHHHRDRPVVLMVHGAGISAIPELDLPFQDYSWMEFLARAGFDVFAVDLTGYGPSSHPPMMEDPCNTSHSDQMQFLIPNPLSQPCEPSYPFHLTAIGSDWDEIDTVVDYLRQLRRVQRVHLVGLSRGGTRMGGYAARHPEKVEKLFLLAPGYDRTDPDDPPKVLPEPGVPMTVLGIAEFAFEEHPLCENYFDPAIVDVIKSTERESDPLGSTWGNGGVLRAPVWTKWGWNPTFAGRVEAPTLVIVGDLDPAITRTQNLYQDLRVDNKVFVHVECADHGMVWEYQHQTLLRACEEWLRQGTFAGQTSGSFFVDADEQVHPE